MPRILVVEDEVAIADTLLFSLAGEGFATHHVALAGEALKLLRVGGFDLVILDVGLPDMTGFEACKQLRQFSAVPVVFLTARGEEIDRVVGLEIGADDYVVKPFSPRELMARVRAILKRSAGVSGVANGAGNGNGNGDGDGNGHGSGNGSGNGNGNGRGEFTVDTTRLLIHYRGELLKLTALEFRLLQQLLSHPEQVQGREQLLAAVGIAADAGYERNIDTHIKSLRAKLRAIAPDREPIVTHRGFGYSYQPGGGPKAGA